MKIILVNCTTALAPVYTADGQLYLKLGQTAYLPDFRGSSAMVM